MRCQRCFCGGKGIALRTALAAGLVQLPMSLVSGVTDHGLHVIAVIMVAVSALALLVTVADRKLMALARPPRA